MKHDAPRVLIVDDNPLNVRILTRILGKHYELEQATNGIDALAAFRRFEPDVVLLDIMMPKMDGYEVCRRIKDSPCGSFTQAILVSGKSSTAERLAGYEAGADDYIVKPFDHEELLSRVRIQFRLRESQRRIWSLSHRLQLYNTELEDLVTARTEEVVATQDVAVFSLARLADCRDPETGEHLLRLRSYSQILAEELSENGAYTHLIDATFLSDLYRSSPLHDIGKVGIPDGILKKPGRLTTEEYEQMKTHVVIGAATLEAAAEASAGGCFLRMAAEVARYHHERWDGSGYCEGLKGDQIPLSARIVAVADVFDAVTSKRVYKDATDPLAARKIIVQSSGSHFDPEVVKAFERRFEDFQNVRTIANNCIQHSAGDTVDANYSKLKSFV